MTVGDLRHSLRLHKDECRVLVVLTHEGHRITGVLDTTYYLYVAGEPERVVVLRGHTIDGEEKES